MEENEVNLHRKRLRLDANYIKAIPPEALKKFLCLEVIKKNGLLIKEIPISLIDFELCLVAVKNNGLALEFIPKRFKTFNLCLKALLQNPESSKYIPENIYKDCINSALKRNKWVNSLTH